MRGYGLPALPEGVDGEAAGVSNDDLSFGLNLWFEFVGLDSEMIFSGLGVIWIDIHYGRR